MFIRVEDTRKRDAYRAEMVAQIIVTVSSGRSFHGDEASQDRMTRAISIANSESDTLQWKCYNSGWEAVTVGELREAVRLAGIEQTKIWGAPTLDEQPV